jgi:hypothetical protein
MRLLTLLLLFSFAFIQCKPEMKKAEIQEVLPEDFEIFYIQFHTDSLFQIEHIAFPLEGVRKVNEGGAGDILVPVLWQRDEWVIHKAFDDFNGSFNRNFQQVGPIILEKITDNNQLFSMERRFAKLGQEWNLIYYGLKK